MVYEVIPVFIMLEYLLMPYLSYDNMIKGFQSTYTVLTWHREMVIKRRVIVNLSFYGFPAFHVENTAVLVINLIGEVSVSNL